MGAGSPAADACRLRHDLRRERHAVRGRPEGVFPAAGHRGHRRLGRRRPGHLVPGDAAEARRDRRHREGGPGGRYRRRLHRLGQRERHDDELRLRLHLLEAARGARRQRQSSDEPAALRARRGAGRDALHAATSGPARRRQIDQRSVRVHAAGRRPRHAQLVGPAHARGHEGPPPS
jgi:hypothetical protein